MEDDERSYTVGEVARIAGVTVRALHHYDEIGLFEPSQRSAAGYRRYAEADLDRLREVLAYRELGFPLEEIAAILEEASDPFEHLRRQRRLLGERIQRLEGIAAAIDREMEARQMEIKLTPEERFEVFGDFDPAEHAEETQDRWGGTDAYEQSRRRVGGYGKEDWQRFREQSRAIEGRLAELLAAGERADGAAAMDAAEEHRQLIDRWFYDCPHAMHVKLGEMYVADARFTAHYEEIAQGLAAFVRDAILANARRV